MRWIEASIDTNSGEIDSLCEKLTQLGVNGLSIEDEADFLGFLENNRQYWDYVDDGLLTSFAGRSRVKFYAEDSGEGERLIKRVREAGFEPTLCHIEDSDWENGWRKYYKPIEVGKKLVVVPEWETPPDGGRLPLRLDPGLIFGTGSHATTRMCLEALESFTKPGKRVLDIGCGSGILGIGALVLGADSVVGCDLDPKAPDVARANAALNGFGGDVFRVYAGDILSDAGLRREISGEYDIVLANIVADVIIPLSERVKDFMAPGGVFICSGIIASRGDEVRSILEKNGLAAAGSYGEEDWLCFVCYSV